MQTSLNKSGMVKKKDKKDFFTTNNNNFWTH